jgi:ribosome maturation factor RimP
MGPLLFYLRELAMALTDIWFQQVIDEALERVELVMVEQAGSKRQRILRLYVDHPDGVTHELCSRVSEVVGKALDDVDAFDGPYTLEVSSPGLERPLRKRAHFEASVGKKVYVKVRVPGVSGRVYQGRLMAVEEEEIILEEAGQEVRIRLGDVSSAHLIYEF